MAQAHLALPDALSLLPRMWAERPDAPVRGTTHRRKASVVDRTTVT